MYNNCDCGAWDCFSCNPSYGKKEKVYRQDGTFYVDSPDYDEDIQFCNSCKQFVTNACVTEEHELNCRVPYKP